MSVTLPVEIEQKIERLANRAGVSVAVFLSSLVDRLPDPDETDRISRLLNQWQAVDGSPLRPDLTLRELTARRQGADSRLSEEDRHRESALWARIEAALLSDDRARV